MRDFSLAFEKSMLAAVRVIDHLIWHCECARTHFGSDSTDRVHCQHAPHTDRLQRPDIGAVIHLMRSDRMSVAVSCQKDHLCLTDFSERKVAGRITEWRTHHFAPRDLQIGEIG